MYSSVGILPVWFTWKHEQTNTESSKNDDNPPFKRQADTNKVEFIAYLTEKTKHVVDVRLANAYSGTLSFILRLGEVPSYFTQNWLAFMNITVH